MSKGKMIPPTTSDTSFKKIRDTIPNPLKEESMHRYIISFLVFTCLTFSFPFLPSKPGSQNVILAVPDDILLLNEISAWPLDNIYWIEIINPTDRPVELDGWTIEFYSGFSYTFPANSGDVSQGDVHELRLNAENLLNSAGDGCILLSSSGPVDSISWGSPPPNPVRQFSPGAPLWPEIAVYRDDQPIFSPGDVCIRIPYEWRSIPGTPVGSDHWRIRSEQSASPGEPNPPPGPTYFTPQSGSELASDLYLAVSGLTWAREFTFQICEDPGFADIVIDETTTEHYIPVNDLPRGSYHWRVRIESPVISEWFQSQEFTVLPFDIDEMIAASEFLSQLPIKDDRLLASMKGGGEVEPPSGLLVGSDETLLAVGLLGIEHIFQHKDTDMVCLDGCPERGDYPWEDPHSESLYSGGHNNCYCSRACLAMIASMGGCNLSQDRITYYIFEEAGVASRDTREAGHVGDPFRDLAHGLGTYYSGINLALEWIYNQPSGSARTVGSSDSTFDDEDPSDMDSIRDLIDAGRPVIMNVPGHSTLIDGYAIVRREDGTLHNSVHIIDPLINDFYAWSGTAGTLVPTNYFCFPPTSGRPVRCDEPEVSMDSDGDYLVDFDEIHRFDTDPNDPDSDADGLNDMEDMYGYLFNPDSSYNLRERDIDGDGVAKELDPDNDRADNDGVNDGCEDVDLDGWFNPDGSESDNFDASDDFSVISPLCYNGFILIEATVHNNIAGSSMTLTVEEYVLMESGNPSSSEDYIHSHEWELTSTPLVLEIPPIGGMPGGTITSVAQGVGDGLARIEIEVDESGHYTVTTDCDPRTMSYTITTTSPIETRSVSRTYYLAIGDHHYGYVSGDAPPAVFNWLESIGPANVFEGEITVSDVGDARIAGTDTIDIPEGLTGLTGTVTRSWEIRIQRGDPLL